MTEVPPGTLLLLYDGVCALCNGTVQFLLERDRADKFRFAPLQSELGAEVVRRSGGNPEDLDTVYLVEGYGTPDERVLKRSRAVLRAVAQLGGPWRLTQAFRVFPTFLLDLGYRAVAAVRYRLFGKHDACPIPAPEHRHKFLAA